MSKNGIVSEEANFEKHWEISRIGQHGSMEETNDLWDSLYQLEYFCMS